MSFAILLAAADGAPDPMKLNLWVAGTALLVFAIAFSILYFKVWPVITKGLDDRNDKILGEIKATEDARSQAKQALSEYEQSLAQAKAEAQRLGDEMKAANERELAERMARAKADIESARRAAVADIHANASELAAAVASRILKREINPADQAALVSEALGELDEAGV